MHAEAIQYGCTEHAWIFMHTSLTFLYMYQLLDRHVTLYTVLIWYNARCTLDMNSDIFLSWKILNWMVRWRTSLGVAVKRVP